MFGVEKHVYVLLLMSGVLCRACANIMTYRDTVYGMRISCLCMITYWMTCSW